MSHEIAAASPSLRLELFRNESPAATIPDRPWHWPFEGKRLETVNALRTALIFLLSAAILRTVLATWLEPTAGERWLARASLPLASSYGATPPLALWLAHFAHVLFGDSRLAMRLPAIVASTAATFGLIRLASRMGWAKGTDAIALVAATVPLFLIGASVSSPEVVLAAFWVAAMELSLALGLGYERRVIGWVRLGVVAGLAVLTKYSGALVAVAAAAWLVSTPHGRRALRTRGPWLAAAAFLAVILPLLAWNATHEWEGLRLASSATPSNATADARRWASFWLWQCFLLGPALVWGWFLLLKRAIGASRFETERRNLRFLAIWAAVPAAVFFVQPIYGAYRPQWAALAYFPVVVYFAKLSAANLSPGLLRRAVSMGILFSAIALVLLRHA